jgi:hypothetical protein
MGRKHDLLSRENAEHRAHIRAAIGRLLRETYEVEVPLTGRLADVMRRIEQSASEGPSGERDPAGPRA